MSFPPTTISKLETSQNHDENAPQSPAYLRIPDHIQQLNDIGAARQILQDFDLTFDFLLLHRFQHFYDAFFVICNVDPFEYFRVFAPTDFPYYFVVVLAPAL